MTKYAIAPRDLLFKEESPQPLFARGAKMLPAHVVGLHHGFEGVFVLGFGVVFDVELRQVVGAEMGDV